MVERRRVDDSRFHEIFERLEAGDEEFVSVREEISKLRKEIETLNLTLKQVVESNTALAISNKEIESVYSGFKATLRVLGWIERGSIWLAKIVIALGLMWAGWKFLIKEAMK